MWAPYVVMLGNILLFVVIDYGCGLQLHSVDRKAEENACASGRSCAAAYPVQVRLSARTMHAESSDHMLANGCR